MTKTSISRILNRTFYYGASGVIGNIIGFIMLPIYTSHLTPADYGVASFLILYVSLVQILLGGKFEAAIAKFHFDKDLRFSINTIISTATLITIIFCIAPLLLTISHSQNISTLLFGEESYSQYIEIISINILVTTVTQYTMQYIRIVDKPILFFSINPVPNYHQSL